jgi:hypothetical protein
VPPTPIATLFEPEGDAATMIEVDPAQAHNLTAFMHGLWLLRIRAGNPSLGVLAKKTGLPKSTLHDGLHRGRSTLPSIDLVRRVLTALGSSAHEVQAWETAWCQLAISLTANGRGGHRSGSGSGGGGPGVDAQGAICAKIGQVTSTVD